MKSFLIIYLLPTDVGRRETRVEHYDKELAQRKFMDENPSAFIVEIWEDDQK